MRPLIAILLILFSLQSSGQKFYSGTYVTSRKDIGFESDIFQFGKEGTFQYVFLTCTGTGFGKGRYEIMKDDSLKLYFIDCAKCQATTDIKTFSTRSDSVEIDLRITALEDDSPLPGVNGVLLNTNIGTVSDANGNLNIRLPRFTEDEVLHINFIGFSSVRIPIKQHSSTIKGIIRLTNNWVYTHEDVKAFKILKWRRSRLRLQRYPKRAISYDKINEGKKRKMIRERMGESSYEFYKAQIVQTGNSHD